MTLSDTLLVKSPYPAHEDERLVDAGPADGADEVAPAKAQIR